MSVSVHLHVEVWSSEPRIRLARTDTGASGDIVLHLSGLDFHCSAELGGAAALELAAMLTAAVDDIGFAGKTNMGDWA